MQLHHLGWAVHSIDAHRDHFERQLGLPYEGSEDFPTLTVAFFRAGATLIELLEPRSDDDDVAQFLRERGEGIHHCAYLVDDVATALSGAQACGLELLDAVPRPGSRRTTIGFVDPRRADGIIVEYVQEPLA